jgi:Family of unknown function (DUF6152)
LSDVTSKLCSRASALATFLITVAVLGAGVEAHHSFAPFDMTSEKTITGIVNRFEWTNPHSWIWVDVPNDKGGVDTWGIEGMSPNYLARRGWSKTSLKPGEKVTVVVRPMRNGQNGGMFVRATLADGRTLVQTGEAKE